MSHTAALSRGARRRPRHGRRSRLALPVATLAALVLLGLCFVAYVLWPRWPTEGVTVDMPALPVTVAGVTFNVKPAAMRIKVQKHTGNQERLDLEFLWPSLEPPDPTQKSHGAPQATDRIFLTIESGEGTLSPAERARSIYPRYIAEETAAGPDGLAVRAFRDSSPYQGEDVIFDPEAADLFLVRCTRNGAAGVPGTCLYDRRIGSADLTFRFPRDWLADWRAIARAADQIVAGLRPTTR